MEDEPKLKPTRAAALAALPLLAMLAGCPQKIRPEAEHLLVTGREAYDRGDDASAIRDTSAFLAEYPNASLSDVAYYLRGLARLRQKEAASAREDLKAAATRSRRRDLRIGALKALGDLAFDDGDMDWAITLYGEELGELGPTERPGEEVRYRLGCALQHRGHWNEADQHFDRVVHAFAGTEAARRAELRLRCTAWTVQAASFERKDLADREAARLRAGGLPATVTAAQAAGRLHFRVSVGRQETYEQAAALLSAVKRLRDDAFVTPTR